MESQGNILLFFAYRTHHILSYFQPRYNEYDQSLKRASSQVFSFISLAVYYCHKPAPGISSGDESWKYRLLSLSHPFYPTFHSSDKSISMLWTEYSPSLFEFHNAYLENKKLYGENKGFLGIGCSIPPKNAYTISVIPWLSFASLSLTSSSHNPYFFPSIEGGKFIREDDRVIFPLSFTSHHATTDGYHVAEFYREFREKSDNFSLFLS